MAQIISKRPGESPKVIDVELTIDNLAELVGGYIQTTSFDGAFMLYDEDGRMKQLPPNFVFAGREIVGPCVIVGTNRDGDDFGELNQRQQSFWMKQLSK